MDRANNTATFTNEPTISAAEMTAEDICLKIDKLYSGNSASVDMIYSQDGTTVYRLLNLSASSRASALNLAFVAENEQHELSIRVCTSRVVLPLNKVQELEKQLKKRLVLEIYQRWGIDIRRKQND